VFLEEWIGKVFQSQVNWDVILDRMAEAYLNLGKSQ
jgi:hypothetical protein